MVERGSNLHWIGGINKRNREPFEPESPPELVRIDLGFELTQLVDPTQKGELQNRIKGTRGSLSRELGFRIPAVSLYEGLDFQPYQYRISVNGVLKGEGECFPDKLKAISCTVNPEERLPGEHAEEFGGLSESIWILKDTEEEASASGYFCVDSETVICVHLNEVMRSEAHQLLGYDETRQLLQSLWKTHPHLVDALVPGTLSMVQVWQVFRAVLETRMTLYCLLLIVESLLEQSQTTQNRKDLVDSIHQALAHSLLQFMVGSRENEIAVIEFDDDLSEVLLVNSTEEIDRFIETEFATRFRRFVLEAEKSTQESWPAVNRIFLVKPDIRFWMSRVMSRFSKDLHVFSLQEIPKLYVIQSIQLIRLRDIFPG